MPLTFLPNYIPMLFKRVFIALWFFVFLSACTKRDSPFYSKDNSGDPEALSQPLGRVNSFSDMKTKIQDWLSAKSLQTVKKASVIANINSALDFSKYRIEQIDAAFDYVVLPLDSNFVAGGATGSLNYLLSTFDDHGDIVEMRIAEVVPDRAISDLPTNAFADLQNKRPSVDGKYNFFNLSEKLLFEAEVNNNVITKTGTKAWDLVNGGSSPCIYTWIVHWTIYPDHAEYDIDIIGMVCDLDENDGGGGGSGGDTWDCDQQLSSCAKDANEFANAPVQVASTSSPSNPDLNLPPPSSPNATLTLSFDWVAFHKDLCDYMSVEQGTMFWSTTQSKWLFSGFTHMSVARNGTLPSCVEQEYSVLSADPSVLSPALARMGITMHFITKRKPCNSKKPYGTTLPIEESAFNFKTFLPSEGH